MQHGMLHSMSAIPHRLMLFFFVSYNAKVQFRALRDQRSRSRRRIANNTFSLSRELGLPRLLRPGTEAIKLYSQRNQLWEKAEKEREKGQREGERSISGQERKMKRHRYKQAKRIRYATVKIHQTHNIAMVFE